jgi:hypothetical protein
MSKVKVILKLVNGRLSLTVHKGNTIEERNKETNRQERILNSCSGNDKGNDEANKGESVQVLSGHSLESQDEI